MSVIDKQVKHVISDFPYYLGDCLIVEKVGYFSHSGIGFLIFRIQICLENKLTYLDVITLDDTRKQFLGVGGFNQDEYNFEISKNICESLSIQRDMQEAY